MTSVKTFPPHVCKISIQQFPATDPISHLISVTEHVQHKIINIYKKHVIGIKIK